MQAVSLSAIPNPYDLLGMAWTDVVACANDVGIDGDALRDMLPDSGVPLRGRSVPVLSPADRGKCSVLLYINRLPGGDEWPFVRFSTFRHGGCHRDFHGLRWWRALGSLQEAGMTRTRVYPEGRELARQRALEEQAERQVRFSRWQTRWQSARPVGGDHPWIRFRLLGQADAGLLSRVLLRSRGNFQGTTLMAPLEHAASSAPAGFQLLHLSTVAGQKDIKRTCIPHAGASRGAFIRIRARKEQAAESLPVAICEGLATGLSIALAWPGEIRVALNAGNLAAVRSGVLGPAIFFHDEDTWKPQVGNVGLRHARQAMRQGDQCFGPCFSPDAESAQPTDYNDLLWLEGPDSLYQQVGAALRTCIA